MKGRWKCNKRQQKKKTTKETVERVDILKALEEQRKHQQEASSEKTNVVKAIPGYFYDTDKKKYFPINMKKDIGCVSLIGLYDM